jgi:hypothetical protein
MAQRVMQKPRMCRDCHGCYRYADYPDTYYNPRYCAACLPRHIRRCVICKEVFHPQIDTDRHCPACGVHPVLFDVEVQ